MLDASASLPPVAFTPSQAVAVATALAVLPPASPFSTDARAASAKVLDTLGPGARARAEALAGRVWVLAEQAEETPAPAVLRAIERSLADHLALSIRYRAADETRSRRRVEPIIVAWTAGRWYLVTHCRLRRDVRWFRFDRIERADVTRDRHSPRPASEAGVPPLPARPVG